MPSSAVKNTADRAATARRVPPLHPHRPGPHRRRHRGLAHGPDRPAGAERPGPASSSGRPSTTPRPPPTSSTSTSTTTPCARSSDGPGTATASPASFNELQTGRRRRHRLRRALRRAREARRRDPGRCADGRAPHRPRQRPVALFADAVRHAGNVLLPAEHQHRRPRARRGDRTAPAAR